jgi:hypothetical protein
VIVPQTTAWWNALIWALLIALAIFAAGAMR